MNQHDPQDDMGAPIDPFEAEERQRQADKEAEEKAQAEATGEDGENSTNKKESASPKDKQSTGEEGAPPTFTPEQAQEADISSSQALQKDQEIKLTADSPNLRHILIGLGWDAPETTGENDEFDLDASVFLLSPEGRVRHDADFVFYNNMETEGGAVRHHGDNRDGQGDGDDEMVTVTLDQVSFEILSIVFAVSIHEAFERSQHFGMVENAYIRLVDMDTNKELLRFNLSEDATKKDAIVLGEIARDGVEWKFHTIGEMSVGGLYEVAKGYGVYVAPT